MIPERKSNRKQETWPISERNLELQYLESSHFHRQEEEEEEEVAGDEAGQVLKPKNSLIKSNVKVKHAEERTSRD